MSVAIGKTLSELRKKLGLSQTKLSEMTGIQNVTISKYENGQQEPGIENLIALSEALQTSVDYILFGEDNNSSEISYFRNKSEGYVVAKEIIDLYEKGFIDINDRGQGYFFDKKGVYKLLSSYKAMMGDDCKNDPGYTKFLETKINNFAKRYDRYRK